MKIQLQIQEQCLPLYFLKPSIGPDWNLCQADSGPWALCLAPDSEYFFLGGGGVAEKKCMNLSKLEKHHWHINSVYSHVPNHMYIFISEKCVRQHLHFEFLARVLLSALYSSCYMLPFSPASYWLCWCQGCYGCEVCGFLSNCRLNFSCPWVRVVYENCQYILKIIKAKLQHAGLDRKQTILWYSPTPGACLLGVILYCLL